VRSAQRAQTACNSPTICTYRAQQQQIVNTVPAQSNDVHDTYSAQQQYIVNTVQKQHVHSNNTHDLDQQRLQSTAQQSIFTQSAKTAPVPAAERQLRERT
jgi:hypothetical protein